MAKKKKKRLVVKDKTKRTSKGGPRYSNVVVNLPANDTDVTLRLPNGQLIDVQFRVESPSVDFCLPEDLAVNNWIGDDMDPAPVHKFKKPGERAKSLGAHIRTAKQLCIGLNPDVLELPKRGWVFVDDDTEEEVGFANPDEYVDADHAVQKFGNEYGDGDFGVYFRDANGKLNSCAAEDTPDDFD